MHAYVFPDPRIKPLICGYERLSKNQWNCTDRCAPFWRLYWNASPGAAMVHQGKRYQLKPSHVFLLAPHASVASSNARAFEQLYLHFHLFTGGDDSLAPVTELALTPLIGSAKDQLMEALHQKEASPWAASLAFRVLVECVLSKVKVVCKEVPYADTRLLKAMAYVEENLGRIELNNTLLAQQSGMGVGALNRLFKQQMGRSLAKYVQTKRVERAAFMLRFSQMSIDEIASEVGFCDRFYFSRVFKSIHRVSPAVFRNMHWEGDAAPPAVEGN